MNLGKTFTLLCNSFDMNLNHPDNFTRSAGCTYDVLPNRVSWSTSQLLSESA